ncbi:hypothetical protein IQ226_22730 [Dolichospermum sp. LEGE 00240]|uniref:hypothetical protein n=1 Tax=Dolichospermum sp. LEGE 00240 TaxID=1828603 RepID=UPI001882E906|nr:hypothetical protein [Dolichospermum sp. LEGE 00240]MBE9251867.1 hypothetical protein [Dolichospermum sp. LEGE 00240]MDM3849222.1 hypothetical protein [Aphanizomenon gracile PMC627.10]
MQIDTSLGLNYTNQSTTQESLERLEEQCDRETEEFLWGAYKFETVDCPDPDETDETDEPDINAQNVEELDTDDDDDIDY